MEHEGGSFTNDALAKTRAAGWGREGGVWPETIEGRERAAERGTAERCCQALFFHHPDPKSLSAGHDPRYV